MTDDEFYEISKYAMRQKIASLLEMLDDNSLRISELTFEQGTTDLNQPTQTITIKTLGAIMTRDDNLAQPEQPRPEPQLDASGISDTISQSGSTLTCLLRSGLAGTELNRLRYQIQK